MPPIEFTAELNGQAIVAIPEELAAQLPKAGMARFIILTDDDPEDAAWRKGAYAQFMRDDAPEDAVYDDC